MKDLREDLIAISANIQKARLRFMKIRNDIHESNAQFIAARLDAVLQEIRYLKDKHEEAR